MSIDLAWKSLELSEQVRIMQYITDEFLTPHTNECTICTVKTYCGAILPIVDVIDAMGDMVDAR